VDTVLHVGLGNAALAAVLALVAGAAGCVLRRPAVVHALWLLVLLKLITPPLIPLPVFQPADSGGMKIAADEDPKLTNDNKGLAETGAASTFQKPDSETIGSNDALVQPGEVESIAAAPPSSSPSAELESLTPSWETIVAGVWLAGSLGWWGLAANRIARFRRLLRKTTFADPMLQDQAERVARRLGLKSCPGVWLVPAPISPLLWAIAGPARILLPAALWQRCSPQQQQTLLAHELAHLRRRDHWVRRLELVVGGLYWWHPAVWWARHGLREAEEQCCDAWVVWALPELAPAYANVLVETVAFLSQARSRPLLEASGIGHVKTLKRRLKMIMRDTPPRALSSVGLLAMLALAAVLLPLLPTRAQESAGEKPVRVRTNTTATDQAAPDSPAPAQAETDAARTRTTIPAQSKVKAGTTVRGQSTQAERAAHLEEAREEVELLEAQLDAKNADVAEAEAVLRSAQVEAKRTAELVARSATTQGELDVAQSKLDIARARVRGKVALSREVAIRIKHARRRLDLLSGTTRKREMPAQSKTEEVKPAEKKDRYPDLEKKLDALQRALENLRKELRPEKPQAMETNNRSLVTIVSRQRTVSIPVSMSPEVRNKTKRINLFVSTNAGKTWKMAAAAPSNTKALPFHAGADGVYWFALQSSPEVDDPADSPPNLKPVMKVRIATSNQSPIKP
jgi:bla regulator protein blaR1